MIIIVLLSVFFVSESTAQERIMVESRLFRGAKDLEKPDSRVVASAYSPQILLPPNQSIIENDSRINLNIQNEITQIYRMNNVTHISTGRFIWNGKKEILTERIQIEGEIFPIKLTPEILPNKNIQLLVEISQIKEDQKMSEAAGNKQPENGELLLKTELELIFNQTVMLGFPVNGHTYFYSLNFSERKSPFRAYIDSFRGYKEITLLKSPNPIFSPLPEYPEQLKKAGIDGTVVLQIKTDIDGNVIEVDILKSAHPELDKIAQETISKWKYDKVIKNGSPISVMFPVTIDFILPTKDK
jgi:TonB family protein